MIPAQYLFARKIAGAALATVVALLTACTTTPPPSEPIPPPAKKGITFTSSDYADLFDKAAQEYALTQFGAVYAARRYPCPTALLPPRVFFARISPHGEWKFLQKKGALRRVS